MRGGVTDAGQTNERTTERTVKIELLSQWKLKAEFRNSFVRKTVTDKVNYFTEHGWGSWNISKTQGPLGDVCETNRWTFFYILFLSFNCFFLHFLHLFVFRCDSIS